MDEPSTMAEILEARASDDAVGLKSPQRQWSWREVVAESRSRAQMALAITNGAGSGAQVHIGVLLDNVPEYLFWLGGAALAGAVVVGVNPTRRGEELASDIRFTECDMLVTDATGSELLEGLDTGVDASRVVRTDLGSTGSLPTGRSEAPSELPLPSVTPEDLYLLIFTSGTTGSPKAVRCTQGRLAMIGSRASGIYGFARDDVCYCPMPLFHGNAIMALWSPAMYVGASLALGGRFSASRFVDDVRLFGATRFTYVGKALAYVLATPELRDDADNSLRIGFGTEASARDRSEFERRFRCSLVEGYGSSEGGVTITRTADTPPDALGIPAEGIAILDPETGAECARARIDSTGRLENPGEAIGELASRSGAQSFEGYYKNDDADSSRVRDGWYWSGDLAYRDESGYVYFAGRNDDWLRVDSENFAAAPVERILGRHPDIVAAAVYPVPDPSSADQVMAAVELRPGVGLGDFGEKLGGFLASQPDLGTKWAPRLVRIVSRLPLTATGKITKTGLKAERWSSGDPVFWRPSRGSLTYSLMTPDDVAALEAEFEDHGRSAFLLQSDGDAADGVRVAPMQD